MRLLIAVLVAFAATSAGAQDHPAFAPQPEIAVAAAKARAALDQKLFDYPAARFRDVRAVEYVEQVGAIGFCGKVNGKNRVGGYTGWDDFTVIVVPDGAKGGSAVFHGPFAVASCRLGKRVRALPGEFSADLTVR